MEKQAEKTADQQTLGHLWLEWISLKFTSIQIIRDVYKRTTNDDTRKHCLYVLDNFEVLK